MLDRYVVKDHIITLVYHPLGFLDRLSSPHGYSSRAAAASACASAVGMFAPCKAALFDNQPEGGSVLDEEEPVELGCSSAATTCASRTPCSAPPTCRGSRS